MTIKLYTISLLLFFGCKLQAQVLLKGVVTEDNSSIKIPNVFVRDNNTKQITLTDNNGRFIIKTEPGHILIFSAPTYIPDTVYIVDLRQLTVKLRTRTISLREVNISARREVFDPHKEYPEVYTRSKVYPLSPSSWFSKDARDARRLKRYFQHEAEERRVDEVFNPTYVGSIVPLKGAELEDFITLYRPPYSFIISNNSESLAVYINDSYKKFMALPPDKRHLQRLTGE